VRLKPAPAGKSSPTKLSAILHQQVLDNAEAYRTRRNVKTRR
jgi:hypothetical protein